MGCGADLHRRDISIHAPREGGDDAEQMKKLLELLISIHAPREGGDPGTSTAQSCRRCYFNPRPPRGGRRLGGLLLQPRDQISIHAPREGGDSRSRSRPSGSPDFNPRPPRGGRRGKSRENVENLLFQSTPPARGATRCPSYDHLPGAISIHAPREGGDSIALMTLSSSTLFQSTPPARGATRRA